MTFALHLYTGFESSFKLVDILSSGKETPWPSGWHSHGSGGLPVAVAAGGRLSVLKSHFNSAWSSETVNTRHFALIETISKM